MEFKIHPTDIYSDYGLSRDKIYMNEIKELLDQHNFKYTIELESKENRVEENYTIEIKNLESLVLLSEILPKQQGLILQGKEIEIYNGYREL